MSDTVQPSDPRVKAIFLEAMELPPGQRAALLDTRCAGDAALREQVEALLAADEQAGEFLAGPTLADAKLPESPGSPPAERQIGPYKLLQVIGEGGFGTVYMAEQETPVRRRVALKVIKLGMDTRQVIARFEAERQALAMMDHPNIAHVFDAGATPSGRPYFVMELVRGEPITQYCDTHRLTPRERLELFVPVCQAVQHAHQKGIIHRDIKPTNVLVTLHDGKPVPKVIDFGIAKATQSRLTEKTVFTEFRQMIGTPEYMSPEQAEMSGLDIDTRSDVYSLGVLLYELLTGTTPFDSRELRSKAFAEIQRVIREVDPPKPSTRLSSMRESTLPSVAAQRHVEPRKLNTIVRGDLDWIVMKCLEKDRTRRYDAAAGLAADVNRYLADEPVSAGPPSATYRVRKFVRRHRIGVGSGVAVALAIVAGLAVASWSLVQVTRERDAAIVARNEAETARQAEAEAREYERQTDKFLTDMFTSIDPAQARGKQILVRDILDQATERIDREPPTHKIVEGSLRFTFGQAYHALGLPDAARKQFERALELYRETHGDDHATPAKLYNVLGIVYTDLGRIDDARRASERSVRLHRTLLGNEHTNTIAAENSLLNLLLRQQKFDEATALTEDLLPRVRRVAGTDSEDLITVLSTAGILYSQQGKYGQAESCFREGYLAARRTLGEDHPYTVGMQTNLGDLMRTAGRFDEAVPLLREAYQNGRRVMGEDHPHTLTVGNNLALALQTVGEYAEAETVFKDVIDRRRRTLGEDHRGTLLARGNYGLVLQAMGRFDEADDVLRSVADGMQRTLGADSVEAMIARNNVAWLCVQRDRLDEAERIYREILPRIRRVAGDESPPAVSMTMRLGHVLLLRENFADAEPLLADAYDGAEKLGIAGKQAGFAAAYGTCLARNGKHEQALPLLIRADEIMTGLPVADAVARIRVIDAVISCYERSNDASQLEIWNQKRAQLAASSPPGPPGGD